MTYTIGLKNKALEYRARGLSYNQISSRLKIPKSTLCTWLKDDLGSVKAKELNIEKTRSVWSRNISKFNSLRAKRYKAEVFDEIIANSKTLPELKTDNLFWIGIGLFMAEGSKREKWSVKFANSDPVIIKLIMRFFREVCKVPENKFRLLVFVHDNCDEEESLKYWSRIAKVPEEQFWRSQIVRSRSSLGVRPIDRLPYGTLRIAIPDTKLNRKIYGWMLGLSKY